MPGSSARLSSFFDFRLLDQSLLGLFDFAHTRPRLAEAKAQSLRFPRFSSGVQHPVLKYSVNPNSECRGSRWSRHTEWCCLGPRCCLESVKPLPLAALPSAHSHGAGYKTALLDSCSCCCATRSRSYAGRRAGQGGDGQPTLAPGGCTASGGITPRVRSRGWACGRTGCSRASRSWRGRAARPQGGFLPRGAVANRVPVHGKLPVGHADLVSWAAD